jgi:hypothetical protein
VQGFRGYGHEYEKAATRTTRGCEKATGHHRMISIVRIPALSEGLLLDHII